jgi:hypothetical protein
MPLIRRGRPLKRWRYVGLYGPELMACVGDAHIGLLPQRWWAVAFPDGSLTDRTTLGRGGVELEGERVSVQAPGVAIAVSLTEGACEPVETVSPNGERGYVWTRKQAGVRAKGEVELHGRRFALDCEAAIDETAGYHRRHTEWRWSAGVGRTTDGRRVGWNLVSGVNDDPEGSERTLWLEGQPSEVGPVEFDADLSGIRFSEGGELRFTEWASREHQARVVIVRSSYRQPFGTFAGELPGGHALAEGYGVMEWHEVRW